MEDVPVVNPSKMVNDYCKGDLTKINVPMILVSSYFQTIVCNA